MKEEQRGENCSIRGSIDTAQMKVAVSHNMAYSYLFVFNGSISDTCK